MALPLTFKLYASEYDAFIKALKVLGHVFGSDYVHSFLAMSVFMGILVASLAVFRGVRGSYEFFKHIAMSLLIVNLFLAKNVTVKVYPMLGGNLVVPEEGTTHDLSLPIGVALPLWGANALSNALVRLIDTGFGCPAHSGETLTPGENLIGNDMLCYSHYGAGGVMGLVAAFQGVSHFTGLIDKNLRIYTEKCLLPAFDLTVVTRTGLERAPDIVEYLAAHSLSNWYSPYQAIPELHGGDSSYPGAYSTCDASEGGIMWNCSCYHVFQLIKSDLAAVEDQFLRSLTEHRVVGVLYGSTTDLTNFRNLVVSRYGQICDATGCPDTTAGIFRHLYLTREIDFFIASYADDPAKMMRLSETYRSTTEGWRGHGRFMFYFLPKIKTLLFASVPFLFLAILPFATLGRTSPFWLLLPNLIWLALWEPNLALLNDLFASEFSDQLLKLTSLWGPAHVGITNGNDVSIYMAANEKLALYGYMSTMTLMLTGIVANAVAWAIGLRGGSMSTYALERELQGVGREVGAGQKYAQLTALSGLAAAREAEAELSGKGRVEAALERNDVGMIFPTGGPPVPAMSRWEIMQELEKGQAMERGYGGLAASTAYGRLLAPKNPIDSPVSPSLVGDAKAQRMAEEAASLRAIRDFLGMDAVGAGTKLGNMAGKLAVWDRFAQYAKYGSEAGFIAAYLSDPRNASFLDHLVEKGILGYDKADLIKRGVWNQHTVERYLSGNPELLGQIRGEMAGYGEAAKLLGLGNALKELSEVTGKPYEELMGYIARGEAIPFISMALKGDLPREARFLAASAAAYIMQQEYETGFGNFLASEKGFSSAGEALKWYQGLPEAEKMEWARKYHQSAAFRDLAGKTRMAEVVSGLTKALGTDGALTFLSKTPLFQLANERAKAARLDLLQALGDGRLDPKEMKRLEEATRGLSAMVGPKMTEHLLSHHLKGMEIPVTKENWLALSNLFGKDQLEKIGLGDPNHLPKDAMALVSLSPKFDKDGNLLGFKGYKLDVVAGGGRNIRYLRTYDEPETERVGRLGSMTISGGTRIMTGDTTEYRGLTGQMGNAEISDGHVVLGRGGTVAEFEGAVKAPDFGSIMALARKIDPQAADRLRTDSRARERIEGALKDGGQVSLDYDNGVLKIRAGSDLLFSSSATDREMVSSVSGRESVYKELDQGKVDDFYVRMDLDRDGRKELYRLSGNYSLDRGIMNFKGDVYRVTSDGSEVKINPRGGITTVEGLRVGGITHGKAEAEDAFNVPTVKLSMFSLGADGRMSPEGVREILKTFSMATDENLDPETRKAAMARGEFYLHTLENDPALRAGFVKSMTDLIHTYIRETHDIDVANKIAAGVRASIGSKSDDAVVGKIVKLFMGLGAEIKGYTADELSKKAEESTSINKFASAIEGVISEANQVLSDEEQMRVLGSMYDTAVGKALNTVREKVGEYETDRALGRVVTGSIPGVDVGRTGERLWHAYWERPPREERARQAEEFAKHKFATSGLAKPEEDSKKD